MAAYRGCLRCAGAPRRPSGWRWLDIADYIQSLVTHSGTSRPSITALRKYHSITCFFRRSRRSKSTQQPAQSSGPTDREDRVLARLVLAKLGADARKQHGKAEGLGDVIIGARLKAEDGVGIRVVASEHVPAQDAHGFAAVDVGQSDIHDHQIDLSRLGGLRARRRRRADRSSSNAARGRADGRRAEPSPPRGGKTPDRR
jgi:hypothetical protein